MRRVLRLGLGVLVVLGLSACGRTAPPARAVKVPVGLVPSSLAGGLNLQEYPGDRKAFAQGGRDSLVADGRLWEIHEEHLLVGTLQISTVTTDISLTRSGDRAQILDGAMVGDVPESVEVDGVGVAVATAPERTLYVWFGHEEFELLQLDDQRVDPETVLDGLLRYQRNTGLLDPEPLPSLGST